MTLTSRLIALTGKTPLIEAVHLAKFLPSGSRFYMKWEGNNPTHTHKDRVAFAHVKKAVKQGFKVLTVGTCGNLGVSIAYFARKFSLRTVIFIPSSYSNTRIEEMISYGAEVLKIDGSYEDAVEASVEAARERGWYDANPGSVNDEVALKCYGDIAIEIVKQLGCVPDVVAIPVGNGTTLAGIYRGFRNLADIGEVVKLPVIVGGTTAYGNQVLASWIENKGKPVKLEREDIVETPVNEPLVAFKSLNCIEALEAVNSTKGTVYGFRDEELILFSHIVFKLEGVRPLPASTSAILATLKYAKSVRLRGVYVSVITGGVPI